MSAKVSEHFIKTLKIAGKYFIWLLNKDIFFFCVIYRTKAIHAITSSFFLGFADFLKESWYQQSSGGQ